MATTIVWNGGSQSPKLVDEWGTKQIFLHGKSVSGGTPIKDNGSYSPKWASFERGRNKFCYAQNLYQ